MVYIFKSLTVQNLWEIYERLVYKDRNISLKRLEKFCTVQDKCGHTSVFQIKLNKNSTLIRRREERVALHR